MKCRVVLVLVVVTLATCDAVWDECTPRRPPKNATRHPKSPGDNGFKIIINGEPERYVPGDFYTVTLVGSRTHNRLQQFTRFSLSADPRDPNVRSHPQTHGTFQLYADTISAFDEECVNVVREADDLPKTEVQVMWRAPIAGSGCVVIKGMVFENHRKWFAEDGQLSRHICEQTTRDSNLASECCACDEAKYKMTFEGLWSNVTHPKDFPTSLWLTHFSDIIGASHEGNFTFWGKGQIASDGFRSLAEWGSIRLMEEELKHSSKYLKTIIKASGLWYPKVNSNTTSTFKVDRRRHLVSLASMFGPTPDWVVGVSELSLCQKDCTWLESQTVDLYPWDAGTDSGVTYMSPNLETKPREKMFRITTKYPEDPRAPFYNMRSDTMNPLARLYLVRESVTPRNCDEDLLQELTVDVAENTEDVARPECGVTEYSAWSPCSVSCGKGLRMRTREYTMPMEKVKMFGCNRQLVSKEMCVADVPECEGGDNTEEDLSTNNAEDSKVCEVTDWSPWSECSATCGVGFTIRSRRFLNRQGGKACRHINTVEQDKCMQPQCTGEDEDVSCPVTPWSDWSPCSTTCGPGTRMRMRMLLVAVDQREECKAKMELMQQSACSEIPSCTLDMATAKQVCMEPTEPGLCRGSHERWSFNTQKAMCVPFVYRGCKGNRNNFLTEQDCSNTCGIVRDALVGGLGSGDDEDVGRNASPQVTSFDDRQDCVVSDWSPWTPCSVSCGYGFAESFRMIKLESRNGGNPCPKRLNKRRRCNVLQC